MSPSRTLPIELVRQAAAFATAHGMDVDAVLRAAGIPGGLARHGRARITESQGVRIVQALWDLTDDEAFGLAEHPLPRGSFRLLCYGVLGAPDLREAVARLSGFAAAIPALPVIELAEDETEARILVRVPGADDPADQLVVWVALGLLHRVGAWLAGRPLDLLRLEMPVPEAVSAEIVDLVFGAPARYDEPAAALVLDRRVLAAPITRTAAELDAFIASSPSGLLSRPRRSRAGTADRVRRLVVRGLRTGQPTAREVARSLGVSEPTLRRQLTLEGTSFREIRDGVLRDAAITALSERTDPIATIAAELGFSEASAFTRAFRRWTGDAPSAYRAT